MRANLVVFLSAVAVTTSSAGGATLYYADAHAIYTVDSSTGAESKLLSVSGVSFLDLADGRSSSVIYAVDGTAKELVAIDLATSPPTLAVVGKLGVHHLQHRLRSQPRHPLRHRLQEPLRDRPGRRRRRT